MNDMTAIHSEPAAPAEAYDPERSMMRLRRIAMIALGALAMGLFVPAALIDIGGAVIGIGQVGVESHVKRIAHPVGGTIAHIGVRNGQHVRKGQVLIRLDDRVTGNDARLSSLSVDQLLAQRARLEAERLDAPVLRFPAALVARADSEAQRAMADERRLFAMRRQEFTSLVGQLRQQIDQREQQIRGQEAQITALLQQGRLIAQELDGIRALYAKQLVTIGRKNQLERAAVDIQGTTAALQAAIAEGRSRITEIRTQIIQQGQSRRSDAGTQLAQVGAMLLQQQERSVSAGDLQERTLIRAPWDGIVDKLAFTTIGDVIRPAETIMEIVPNRDRLLVEAAVSPADIDQLQTGQKARVRFSALNMASTPELAGRLVHLAAERTVNPQTQASYYAVRVEVDPALIARNGIVLKPGMPAEVFIETGARPMLSYLTKPLRDQLARAFRDN